MALDFGGCNSRPETGLLHPMASSRLFLSNEKARFLGISLQATGRHQFRCRMGF
jgi:hypothetical protein